MARSEDYLVAYARPSQYDPTVTPTATPWTREIIFGGKNAYSGDNYLIDSGAVYGNRGGGNTFGWSCLQSQFVKRSNPSRPVGAWNYSYVGSTGWDCRAQKCLEAAVAQFGDKVTSTRGGLQSGSWSHIPPGCTVQSGGDWAAHYNSKNSSATYPRGGTAYALPCADTSGNTVTCPTDVRQAAAMRPTFVHVGATCKESAGHSKQRGKLTVYLPISATVTVKSGCSTCNIRFTNTRTGAAVAVESVLHWSWPQGAANTMFFSPRAPATAADINAAFAKGDTITVTYDDTYTPVTSFAQTVAGRASQNKWEMAVSNGVYRVTWYHIIAGHPFVHVAGCVVENNALTDKVGNFDK